MTNLLLYNLVPVRSSVLVRVASFHRMLLFPRSRPSLPISSMTHAERGSWGDGVFIGVAFSAFRSVNFTTRLFIRTHTIFPVVYLRVPRLSRTLSFFFCSAGFLLSPAVFAGRPSEPLHFWFPSFLSRYHGGTARSLWFGTVTRLPLVFPSAPSTP